MAEVFCFVEVKNRLTHTQLAADESVRLASYCISICRPADRSLAINAGSYSFSSFFTLGGSKNYSCRLSAPASVFFFRFFVRREISPTRTDGRTVKNPRRRFLR